MKLISMTEFVIHESFGVGNEIISKDEFCNKCSNYANFLKQPLTLGMFIPCDEEGNILEEPDHSMYFTATTIGEDKYNNDAYEYEQAEERVLFEGFHVIGVDKNYCHIELKNADLWIVFYNGKICLEYSFNEETSIYTIEDIIEYNLTLTDSAIKQLGL